MFRFTRDSQPFTMGLPPLVRAVTQVTYPPAPQLAAPQGLADLQDALGEAFVLQAIPTPAFQISIGPPLTAQRNVFATEDGYSLAVTAQDITLSIDERYKDRAAFAAVLGPVLAAVGKIGKIKHVNRLGVRYINALPCTIEEFVRWFKPEFTGWAGSSVVNETAHRAIVNVVQLNDAEMSPANVGVIRYGYLPNGVGLDVTSAPAGSQPSFLADIDLALIQENAFEPDKLIELHRAINHEIAAFLENSLSENGIEHFALKPKE